MLLRLAQFSAGLALCGLSLAMMVRAGLGLGPWDVFHQGMAASTGLSIGIVLMLTGVAVLLLWVPLRQKLRWGTFANQVGVGFTADLFLWLLPDASGVAARAAMLAGGTLFQGVGIALYIGAGFGPGPRDGLMTGLVARTRWSVRSVRTGIELGVLAFGWLLGGTIGVGTLLYAVTIGPVVHAALPWFDRGGRRDATDPTAASAG